MAAGIIHVHDKAVRVPETGVISDETNGFGELTIDIKPTEYNLTALRALDENDNLLHSDVCISGNGYYIIHVVDRNTGLNHANKIIKFYAYVIPLGT